MLFWKIAYYLKFYLKILNYLKILVKFWEGSDYVLGFKYIGVLNICKFSLIWQTFEYASGCIMEGFCIFQDPKYARFLCM